MKKIIKNLKDLAHDIKLIFTEPAILLYLLPVFILIGIFLFNIVGAYRTDTYTVTISEKTVKNYNVKYSNGSNGIKSKYLVFTTDGEVYEITDTILRWRFNSSNLYGKLQVGKTYKITVNGFRIPLFSEYRNILKATEVK